MSSRSGPVIAIVFMGLVLTAGGLYFASRAVPRDDAPTRALSTYLVGRALPPLDQASGWLNGGPLTRDSLAGRLAALVVWSDTDPASPDALLRLEEWRQGYARFGVRVIGVHVPEYAFAADSAVPARVARRLGVQFPIALDPDYRLRRQLVGPEHGPRIVLTDTAGVIRWEGGGDRLAEGEAWLVHRIRALHPELNLPGRDAPESDAAVPGAGDNDAVRRVPLGSSRATDGPLAGAEAGRAQVFTAQFRFQVEGKPFTPYPVGLWTPGAEGVLAARGGAENFIALRYTGGRVDVVASPSPGAATRFWVLRDERWLDADELGDDARRDGRGASYVDVVEPRLYRVCRAARGEHVLKLSPDAPGLTLHALVIEPGRER